MSMIPFYRRVHKIAKRELCMSVWPSVRMEQQLGSHWTDFREILFLGIFRKPLTGRIFMKFYFWVFFENP